MPLAMICSVLMWYICGIVFFAAFDMQSMP